MNAKLNQSPDQSADDVSNNIREQDHQIGSTVENILALISQQPFFAGMCRPQLELLAQSAVLMQFDPGEWIFSEGDLANRFYLVLEGGVELDAETDDRGHIAIQQIGPGDDLGWSWLFPPYHFHFSARAITATSVICFYGTRVRQQCESDHVFGHALMERVAQVTINRLQATRRQLLKLTAESQAK